MFTFPGFRVRNRPRQNFSANSHRQTYLRRSRYETGWPDWANFRLLGECLLLPIKKNRSSPKFGATFSRIKLCIDFDKKTGDIFCSIFFLQKNHPITLFRGQRFWLGGIFRRWSRRSRKVHTDSAVLPCSTHACLSHAAAQKQGDQMLSWNKRPKCIPTIFSQIRYLFFTK
jgi:hypothetical protein